MAINGTAGGSFTVRRLLDSTVPGPAGARANLFAARIIRAGNQPTSVPEPDGVGFSGEINLLTGDTVGPQNGDVVIIQYSGDNQQTGWIFSTVWTQQDQLIDGSLLVTGTVTADVVNANTSVTAPIIEGGELRAGTIVGGRISGAIIEAGILLSLVQAFPVNQETDVGAFADAAERARSFCEADPDNSVGPKRLATTRAETFPQATTQTLNFNSDRLLTVGETVPTSSADYAADASLLRRNWTDHVPLLFRVSYQNFNSRVRRDPDDDDRYASVARRAVKYFWPQVTLNVLDSTNQVVVSQTLPGEDPGVIGVGKRTNTTQVGNVKNFETGDDTRFEHITMTHTGNYNYRRGGSKIALGTQNNIGVLVDGFIRLDEGERVSVTLEAIPQETSTAYLSNFISARYNFQQFSVGLESDAQSQAGFFYDNTDAGQTDTAITVADVESLEGTPGILPDDVASRVLPVSVDALETAGFVVDGVNQTIQLQNLDASKISGTLDGDEVQLTNIPAGALAPGGTISDVNVSGGDLVIADYSTSDSLNTIAKAIDHIRDNSTGSGAAFDVGRNGSPSLAIGSFGDLALDVWDPLDDQVEGDQVFFNLGGTDDEDIVYRANNTIAGSSTNQNPTIETTNWTEQFQAARGFLYYDELVGLVVDGTITAGAVRGGNLTGTDNLAGNTESGGFINLDNGDFLFGQRGLASEGAEFLSWNGTNLNLSGVTITGASIADSTVEGASLQTWDAADAYSAESVAIDTIDNNIYIAVNARVAGDARPSLDSTNWTELSAGQAGRTEAAVNTLIDNRVNNAFVDALNVDADTLDNLDSTDFYRSNNPSNFADDQTGTEIVTAINASSSLVDDDNIAATIARTSAIRTDTQINTLISNRVTNAFVDALNVDADTLDGLTSTDFYRSNNPSGFTNDQTGPEIVTSINASSSLVDDNNIASTIARTSAIPAPSSGTVLTAVVGATGADPAGTFNLVGSLTTSNGFVTNGVTATLVDTGTNSITYDTTTGLDISVMNLTAEIASFGAVTIDTADIEVASIGTLFAETARIEDLTATNAAIEILNSESITTGAIQSNTFDGVITGNDVTNNGTLGWAISGDGSAVFNDVVVRGDLTAWSINGLQINNSGDNENIGFGENVFMNAGSTMFAAERNVAIGRAASQDILTVAGSDNVAIGSFALQDNQSGGSNVAVGNNAARDLDPTAGQGVQGNFNVAVGLNAGFSTVNAEKLTNESSNVMIGHNARASKGGFSDINDNVVTRNVAVGASAQAYGKSHVAIGDSSRAGGSSGGSTSLAVAIGQSSEANFSGSIAIGQFARTDNAANQDGGQIALGFQAQATGNNTIAIGSGSGSSVVRNNSISIGNGVAATVANEIRIGTSTQTAVIAGTAFPQTLPTVNDATITFSSAGDVTANSAFSLNQSAAETITLTIPTNTVTNGQLDGTLRDRISDNDAKLTNVTTNLSFTTTDTTVTVTCSDGTNATLMPATLSQAGIFTATERNKLVNISEGARPGTMSSFTFRDDDTTTITVDDGDIVTFSSSGLDIDFSGNNIDFRLDFDEQFISNPALQSADRIMGVRDSDSASRSWRVPNARLGLAAYKNKPAFIGVSTGGTTGDGQTILSASGLQTVSTSDRYFEGTMSSRNAASALTIAGTVGDAYASGQRVNGNAQTTNSHSFFCDSADTSVSVSANGVYRCEIFLPAGATISSTSTNLRLAGTLQTG